MNELQQKKNFIEKVMPLITMHCLKLPMINKINNFSIPKIWLIYKLELEKLEYLNVVPYTTGEASPWSRKFCLDF